MRCQPSSLVDRVWNVIALIVMLSVAWEAIRFAFGFEPSWIGSAGAGLLLAVILLSGIALGSILIVAFMRRALGMRNG